MRIIALFMTFANVCFLSIGFAQTDFFWSDKDIGQGAVNAPLFINAAPGDAADLYLYYTTNGPTDSNISRGLSLDLRMTQGARFLTADTLDFDVTVFGNIIGTRWMGGVYGATGKITDQLIDELSCFGAISDGICDFNTGPVFFDEGYDEEADAFLIAKVQVAVESFCGIEIFASVGNKLIVDDAILTKPTSLNPTFGCVHICDPIGLELGPPEGCSLVDPILGDVNLDGVVNLLDVEPFVDVLAHAPFQAEADINRDNVVDVLDVQGMVNILAGRCPWAFDGPIQSGDMNCDGCIDILDLNQLVQYVSINSLDLCDPTVDLNGDGIINLLEVDLLQQLILNQN